MATTTTNYGFDIPQSTDLVKDGATAIATLCQDIDTAMNTALGTKKAGMVLLNTTSFSAVASASFPAATFTSTYDNYQIVYKIFSADGLTNLFMRFRVGGADNTTANYASIIARDFNTSRGGFTPTFGATSFAISNGTPSATIGAVGDLLISSPFLSEFKSIRGRQGMSESSVSGVTWDCGGGFNASTSFDSLSLFTGSGNFSGFMSAYGFSK